MSNFQIGLLIGQYGSVSIFAIVALSPTFCQILEFCIGVTSTRRGVRLRWTGGGGPAPCGRPHRKLKLESTDVILSSSHAKKLASFFTRISSLDRKKVEIFLRYKLLIVQFK